MAAMKPDISLFILPFHLTVPFCLPARQKKIICFTKDVVCAVCFQVPSKLMQIIARVNYLWLR